MSPDAVPAAPSPTPERLRRWSTTALLLALTVPTDLFHMHSAAFRRLEPVVVGFGLVAWLVGNCVFYLPWSALWALAGRLVRHEAGFLGHLNTVLTAQLAWTWVKTAFGTAVFAFGWDAWAAPVMFLLAWAALGTLIAAHLRFVVASPPRVLCGWGFGVSTLLVGTAFGVWSMAVSRSPGMRVAQIGLMPPALLLERPVPVSQHLALLDGLQAAVDARVAADGR